MMVWELGGLGWKLPHLFSLSFGFLSSDRDFVIHLLRMSVFVNLKH